MLLLYLGQRTNEIGEHKFVIKRKLGLYSLPYTKGKRAQSQAQDGNIIKPSWQILENLLDIIIIL
ncbi:hypothetical protein ArsFIN_15970 [Arsenophonus nasoniae]|uniref:Uncharacterized protein n=1 Tax=Arsenophonus nasoniae TaxID=638 RepID=A0A4V1BWQ7_9GAMM|nr:hypothetical protein ArsFIN_15970 [Arsenophonus nasoniae]